jgi:tRNA U34 2-thiouridine synthase MnmA/TrmU
MKLTRIEQDMLLEDPDYLDVVTLKNGRALRPSFLEGKKMQPCVLCNKPTKLKGGIHKACATRAK